MRHHVLVVGDMVLYRKDMEDMPPMLCWRKGVSVLDVFPISTVDKIDTSSSVYPVGIRRRVGIAKIEWYRPDELIRVTVVHNILAIHVDELLVVDGVRRG